MGRCWSKHTEFQSCWLNFCFNEPTIIVVIITIIIIISIIPIIIGITINGNFWRSDVRCGDYS